jgi:16S rRNA (uracil1498-N3)-methyltransferase
VSLHRFFLAGELPESAAEAVELALTSADRHHLVRVVRLGPGDRIMVVGTDRREAEATLVEATLARVVADIDDPVVRPAHPRVALAPALARRERMEFAIQKCTEVGVTEILPVATCRSVVQLDEERSGRRGDRWRRIAEAAAKQSQRAEVPVVRDPLSFDELAAEAARFDVVLVPWEEATTGGLGIGEALDAAGATPDTSVLIVIGPEGGLAADEVSALEAAGGVACTLGDTVLRTETAALVAVSLAIYELGGLGGRDR